MELSRDALIRITQFLNAHKEELIGLYEKGTIKIDPKQRERYFLNHLKEIGYMADFMGYIWIHNPRVPVLFKLKEESEGEMISWPPANFLRSSEIHSRDKLESFLVCLQEDVTKKIKLYFGAPVVKAEWV